jgi:hypothetical protein
MPHWLQVQKMAAYHRAARSLLFGVFNEADLPARLENLTLKALVLPVDSR